MVDGMPWQTMEAFFFSHHQRLQMILPKHRDWPNNFYIAPFAFISQKNDGNKFAIIREPASVADPPVILLPSRVEFHSTKL